MAVIMAILKASYTKDPEGAKASIRYIAHRPRQTGERVGRQLFGPDGAMTRNEAENLIDGAGKGSVFFRFVISPDPDGEDTGRDLHLRLVTEETMSGLSEALQTPVGWVAAVHDDHSAHRHVHVIAAIQGRLERSQLQLLREQATRVCQRQRTELDRASATRREREEVVWELHG